MVHCGPRALEMTNLNTVASNLLRTCFKSYSLPNSIIFIPELYLHVFLTLRSSSDARKSLWTWHKTSAARSTRSSLDHKNYIYNNFRGCSQENLTFHRPESVFNPTASSFPSSCQHLTESDKVLVNLTFRCLVDDLWAIRIANLTAGAKHFCKVLLRNRSLIYLKILLTDNEFGQYDDPRISPKMKSAFASDREHQDLSIRWLTYCRNYKCCCMYL